MQISSFHRLSATIRRLSAVTIPLDQVLVTSYLQMTAGDRELGSALSLASDVLRIAYDEEEESMVDSVHPEHKIVCEENLATIVIVVNELTKVLFCP